MYTSHASLILIYYNKVRIELHKIGEVLTCKCQLIQFTIHVFNNTTELLEATQ